MCHTRQILGSCVEYAGEQINFLFVRRLFFYFTHAVVAKYCDDYICLGVSLSVCLSVREDISAITCAIFIKFPVRVAYVHGSVLLLHVDAPAASPVGGKA